MAAGGGHLEFIPILTLYQARAATLMPFSKEGTILIKKNL